MTVQTQTEARLTSYEQRYGMTSWEFYQRFRAGELGDDMDFVEWSVFWDMHQAVEKRSNEQETGILLES